MTLGAGAAAAVLFLAALGVPMMFSQHPRAAAFVGTALVAAASLVILHVLVTGWPWWTALAAVVVVLVGFGYYLRGRRRASTDTPAAFTTSHGGKTTVEGGTVTGYDRVSDTRRGGITRFVRVRIRKRP